MGKQQDWKKALKADPTDWLLERDDPGVRYLALRDIVEAGEKELKAARTKAHREGPIAQILENMTTEGYWDKPGAGYGPKYRGTQWALVFMAQLGADGNDPRIRAGCEYLLSHTIASNGALSWNGTTSGFEHCTAGNLGAALVDFGFVEDPRLRTAMEWLAQTITGEGVANASNRDTNRRYFGSGNSAPRFVCSKNANLSCAWGAIKAMIALSKVPAEQRTRNMQAAIKQGLDFLLSHDPAVADYPFGRGNKPSSSWFKFGYPIGYITDVLQNLEVLVALGQAENPKLANALKLVLSKQDEQGRWKLEYTYNGKSWVDIEKKGQPSKWVTLRALRVLKRAGQ